MAHAPGIPQILEQIAALRDDPMEAAEVRAAAAERLTTARACPDPAGEPA